MKKRPALDLDRAEAIAIAALGFLAGDPERLTRFLTLTGLGPADLRQRAGSPEVLAAVLDFLLGDESALLVFTASAALEPEQVAPSAELLRAEAGRRNRA